MWKNTTSYSKSSDKTEVRTTSLRTEHLDITVTKHIHYGDELVMSCDSIGIQRKPLGVEDMEEGQRKAIDIVERRLKEMLFEIEKVKS